MEEWKPSEAPYLKVGDTIEMSNVENLLKSGAVILVDETTGADKPRFAVMGCPVCNYTSTDLEDYAGHIYRHVKKPLVVETPKVEVKVEPKVESKVEAKAEEVKKVKVFHCSKCDFTTDGIVNLGKHAREVHK